MITPEIAQEISDQIPGVSAERILQLVHDMNLSQAFFRGVRYQQEWNEAQSETVYTRGAEGGGVSYWTSGVRVFNANGSDHLQPYDTTFFHYATGMKGFAPRMYVLATTGNRVPGYFLPDAFIQVHETLSLSQYECLEVVGKPLQSLQAIYPAMIVELEDFVSNR